MSKNKTFSQEGRETNRQLLTRLAAAGNKRAALVLRNWNRSKHQFDWKEVTNL